MKKFNTTTKLAITKPLSNMTITEGDLEKSNQNTKIVKRETSISRLTTKSQPETKTLFLSDIPPKPLTQKSVTIADTAFRDPHHFSKSLAHWSKEQNPMFVCIKDQIINEMVVTLLKSEKDRVKKNVDSNKLTLIEHKNCSMLFSKNGSDPLTNRANAMSGSRTTFEGKFFKNILSDSDEESNQQQFNSQRNLTNRNFLLRIHGMNHHLVEIYNETTGSLNDNPRTVDINFESRKAISKDLRDNPMKDNDKRLYKIEVFKPNSSKPQIVRLMVYSQNIQKNRNGFSLPRLLNESLKKGPIWKSTAEPTFKFLDLDEI